MTDRIKIRLTATEMMVAAYVGSARNTQAITRQWSPGNNAGEGDSWTKHIEGVGGEISVAKHLNVYWQPIVGNPDADDVGPYQVRTNMSRRLTDLCLRRTDKPDRIYISVLSYMPEFIILGFIRGADGMLDRWYRDGTPGRPAFWVPAEVLSPMSELPPS